MSKNDLFGPPTDQELEEFAPPTEDELAEVSSPKDTSDEPSMLESGLGGIKTGTTLGFRDELAGAAGAVGYGAGILDSGRIPRWEELLTAYREAKGEEKLKEAKEKEASPKAFLAGEVIGGLTTPGIGAAKSVGQIAKNAAISGGVAGLGTSDADLTRGEATEALQDTALGAGTGAALGTVFGAVGKGIKKLTDSKKLRETGEKQVLSALTPQRKVIEKELLGGKGGLKGIGKALSGDFVDEAGKKRAIFSTGARPEEVVDNLDKALTQHLDNNVNPLLERAQDRINQKLSELRQVQELSGTSFIDDIQEMVEKRAIALIKKGQTDKAKNLRSYMEAIVGNNQDELRGFDLKQLNQLKRSLGEELKPGEWEKVITGEALPSYQKEATKDFYYMLKNRIEKLADKVSSPEEKLGQQLRDVNMKTSNLLDAKSAAIYDHTRRLDNPSLTLKDMVLPSIAGVATTNPLIVPIVLGGTTIIEKTTGRKMGKVTELATGRGLNKLASFLEKSSKSKAGPILRQIKKLENVPLAERAGAITQLIKENPDVFEIQEKIADEKTAILEKQSNIINSASNDINELINVINESKDDNFKQFMNPLKKAANAERDQTRKAIMWGLSQQPAFRELLTKIQKENK